MTHDQVIILLALAMDLIRWPLFFVLLAGVIFECWVIIQAIRAARRGQ